MNERMDNNLSEQEFNNAITFVFGDVLPAERVRLYALVVSDSSKTISYDKYPCKAKKWKRNEQFIWF